MKPNRLLLSLLTAGLAHSPASIVAQTPPTAAPAKKAEPTPTPTTAPKPAESVEQSTLKPAMKLESVEVLGSRIRRTETEGPSPISAYTLDEIRSSGALTLNDFLNNLPQTYGGVTVGRNSTPNDLSYEGGQRNEGLIATTPFVGASPNLAPPVQTGVSGVSLRSLGSGSTLVLVDGRRVAQSANSNRASQTGQGFVDINTIPLGLIDRIEVITDGASAIYGADAVAGVINVILKKNWNGHELSGAYKATEHGGGRERSTSLVSGFASGKFRGTVALDYYDRMKMTADQRSFSRNMDHRDRIRGYTAAGAPIFGTDQRIQWGYPATVQALVGSTTTLGTFDALPGVRVVLSPLGAATTPAISAFIPRTTVPDNQTGTVVNAQGQRPTNVSNFLELVPESQRLGFTGSFNYAIKGSLETYGTYSYSDVRGLAGALPAYSATSVTGTLVPAAFNPFGQNVFIGMLHPEFGVISQRTRTTSHSLTAGLRGSLGNTWRWDSGYRWQRQAFNQINRNFNPAAFTAALANPDPAQRLNPFIDAAAAGLDRTAVYERMALYPTLIGRSGATILDASANGDLFMIWGGPIKTALGGSFEQPNNVSTSTTFSSAVVPVTTITTFSTKRDIYAAFGELSVPVFGKPNALPLLRRFELSLAGRYEDQASAGSSGVPKYGASWVPFPSILFRASYSEGFRAPALTENRVASSTTTTTVNDPRRGNLTTTVNLIRGTNPALKPETSTNEFYGVVFEPTFVKGLNLQVNYYRTAQDDAIQSLSTTTILNNEALFGDRIKRTAPSAADTAAGQPGAITDITTYFVNFGSVRNESIDFIAEYRIPFKSLGSWRVAFNAAHTLKAERQLAPNSPPINDVDDTYSGPKWKTNATVYWQKGPWNASANVNYMSGFKSNLAGLQAVAFGAVTPGVRKYDARVGYEFRQGVWRSYGKDLRVNFGVSNLLDQEPPFFDVVYGYTAALHSPYVFGRTYELSFSIPIK